MYIINLIPVIKNLHTENPAIMKRAEKIEKIVKEECDENRIIDIRKKAKQALEIYATGITMLRYSTVEPTWNNDARSLFWYIDAITDSWFGELKATLGCETLEKLASEFDITLL